MNLYVKNMVCNRCIMVVRKELEKLKILSNNITLGEIEVDDTISKEQIQQLGLQLQDLGFELLDDAKKQLIEKIKNIVIDYVHYNTDDRNYNFSNILSQKLYKDYSYLSSLFSEVEGITIEKYVIHQKIEKVKELLIYDELNLTEIAFQVGYSSVAHLSAQFKKVTGLTPSHFKKVRENKRKPLDKV